MVLASANFGESYILEVVGLVLVVVFIVRRVAPPLAKLMNDKQASIRSQLAAGDEARAAAEQVVAKRAAELEVARQEAATILDQARVSAGQLVDDGRRRAEDEYQRLVTRASTELDLARSRAREEVMAHIASLVVAAAEAVVESELDSATHHHLIDEAIAAAESERR